MSANYESKYTKIPDKIFEIGLTPTAIAVFCALAKHGGAGKNDIFPSRERVAKMIGCSVASVKRALEILKNHRVIEWKRGYAGRANTYELNEIGLWITYDSGSYRPYPAGPNEPSSGSYRPEQWVLMSRAAGPNDPLSGSYRPTNHTSITKQVNQTNEPGIFEKSKGEEKQSTNENNKSEEFRIRQFASEIVKRMQA